MCIYIITYAYDYIYSHHLFCISFLSPSQSIDIHVPTVEPQGIAWHVRLVCTRSRAASLSRPGDQKPGDGDGDGSIEFLDNGDNIYICTHTVYDESPRLWMIMVSFSVCQALSYCSCSCGWDPNGTGFLMDPVAC